jgi:hypothetical protein
MKKIFILVIALFLIENILAFSVEDTLINYSPLSVGNQYQLSGEGYFCYDFFQTSITKDTIIQGEKYYFYYRTPNTSFWQMIDSTGKLWIWNGQKILWMDFSLEAGQTLNGKTIRAGVSNLFGQIIPWKGYSVSGESVRWGYGLGQIYRFTSSSGPTGILTRQVSLIQMKTNDSVIFSHWYYPVILFNPLDTVTSFNLSISAEVRHAYTRSPSCNPEQYIDYLQFQSHYKRQDSLITNNNITRPSPPYSTQYTINYLVDSNLIKKGFQFYYRLMSKDKGISPHYSFFPQEGYLEIYFAGLTNINEEKDFYQFKLYQNYPNPFNPSTKIKYSIPQSSKVTLKVFDILGKEVAVLVNEEKAAGEYEVEFSVSSFGDGGKLSSGVYFYQLRSGEFVQTNKMILMR